MAPPPLSPSRYATRSAESGATPALGSPKILPADWYTAALAMAQSKAREMLCVLVGANVRAAAHSGTRLPLIPRFARSRNLLLGVGVLLALGLVALLRAAVASAFVAVIIANAKVTK